MRIVLTVNAEDTAKGEIDPDDLCGGIALIHDGAEIRDDLIYLENWFDCLVDACVFKSNDGIYKCDLVSEPDPLVFRFANDQVNISYQSQELRSIPFEQFFNAVVTSGKKFIDLLKSEVPYKERISLKKLEEFLAKTPIKELKGYLGPE